MLYEDDTVLMAESSSNLQTLLAKYHKASRYTVPNAFSKSTKRRIISFFYFSKFQKKE
jgi:hypothetical protein